MRCRLAVLSTKASKAFVYLLLASLFAFHCASLLSAQEGTLQAVPRAVQSGALQMVGPMAPQQMLRLTVALKVPHPEEEESLVQQLHDPDSPLFHEYLSAEEWNARFSPSEESEQAVIDWARSHGLTVTHRYPNRLLVELEAPVSAIQAAFNVSINTYQKGDKQYFSIDRDPSLPSSLTDVVQYVFGLSNVNAMRHLMRRPAGVQENEYPIYSAGPAYARGGELQQAGDPHRAQAKVGQLGSSGPYGPPDLYDSYAYDFAPLKGLHHCCNPLGHSGGSPPESSIAVSIWGDYSDTDLHAWAQNYGLALSISRILVGAARQCGNPPAPACDIEATADAEYTSAMANNFGSPSGTAHIYEYEGLNGDSMQTVLNQIMTDGKVRVVNMSWGIPENELRHSELDSWNNLFRSMTGQGITPVAASGDGGASADCETTGVLFPASDQYVVAVGGTNLNTIPGYRYTSEKGWQGGTDQGSCSNNDGGSGGGCSGYFAAPSYQPNACSHKRSVPDIALNADGMNAPEAIIFQNSMWYVGGTSLSSPQMAGFFAQENAYLLYIESLVGKTCSPSHNAHCAPLGWANTDLYNEAVNHRTPHYPFYDITSGCNSNDATHRFGLHYYCAATGYDQVTGWGSANMFQLAWSINYLMAGDAKGPATSVTGPPVNHWYNVDQTIQWTITDQTVGVHPANGVAGYSQAWDADPGDPASEAHPGGGNSFYALQAYASSGSASGLSGLSQGCHSAKVRAWDNGGNSALASYGPLCYDSINPFSQVNLSGNFQGNGYEGPVEVTVSATDNASGVAATYYSVDDGNFVPYTGAFYVYTPHMQHCVRAYSVDVAGNQEPPELSCFYILTNPQVTVTVSKPGSGTGTVTSNDGAINCGSTCSGQYYPGQPVALTAAPTGQSLFTGWRNCDASDGFTCTLTVLGARTVSAVFNHPVAMQFVPMSPCRVVDTRIAPGQFGGPAIAGGTSRSFPLPVGPCAGIPSNVSAYSLNVTIVPHGPLNFLTAWPTGFTMPNTSLMNSDSRVKANAAILPAGDSGSVSVFVTDTSDVILDINGYFVAPASNTLAFFPLTPCRVADTRQTDGDLGGPMLQEGQTRNFPILEATQCAIPSDAVAYSLNLTALPQNGQPLDYITAWPTGGSQPDASTLNSPGAITANAAIVRAGTNGNISVYASGNNTGLLIDIDGYFAPANSHPNPLSLYTFNPCRALDTRQHGGAFSGTLAVGITSGPCDVSPSAKAYTFNGTVVPVGSLGYLTLWPDGAQMPDVSTLNAYDGAITSNMAIVPTSNGSIDAYAYGTTQLLLDVSSYFAP